MTSLSRLLAVGAVALAAVLSSGCTKDYETPNTPVPEGFRAVGLDGTAFSRESLDGKPWVINLWLPG
jgi:cytochrome oxidase Cu insertion factor (SCO1/SenC/PrrC family)